MSDSREWVWMPHAAHLIVSDRCRFHLATYVPSGYLISTVGEYKPAGSGEDDAFETVGCDRLYETMVFPATPSEHVCCPWTAAKWTELECTGYNDPGAAAKGHVAACEKWAGGAS